MSIQAFLYSSLVNQFISNIITVLEFQIAFHQKCRKEMRFFPLRSINLKNYQPVTLLFS